MRIIFIKIKEYTGSYFIFSAKKIRLSLIKQGIPFLLPYLVLSLHENISTILVYRYLGDKETGILAQSLKIMKIIKIYFVFICFSSQTKDDKFIWINY